jgi:iron uptake system EfeUOB component EfeO/EfeM
MADAHRIDSGNVVATIEAQLEIRDQTIEELRDVVSEYEAKIDRAFYYFEGSYEAFTDALNAGDLTKIREVWAQHLSKTLDPFDGYDAQYHIHESMVDGGNG